MIPGTKYAARVLLVALVLGGCHSSTGGSGASEGADLGDPHIVSPGPDTSDVCSTAGGCGQPDVKVRRDQILGEDDWIFPRPDQAACTSEEARDDGDPCTLDRCDADGTCSHAVRTGAPCDDGDCCTENDRCAACLPVAPDCPPSGAVCGGAGLACDDDDPCTEDGCACEGGADGCVHPPAPDGTTCVADPSACTEGDACRGGVCVQGAPLILDDGDPCTRDWCDKGNVAHEPVADGVCVACRPGDEPPPEVVCEGICALYPPECVDDRWVCLGPTLVPEEERCDGFDNDCDGEVDEGCATCTVDVDRIRTQLDTKWDIDFDYACNTFLTTMRSGPDFVTMVPADPAALVVNYYGNANQNMGYALVDPDPAHHRVVVTYSCCSHCACQAYNGLTLLYTCDPSDPDCGCAGQTNCPGFLNVPFLRAGFENTGVYVHAGQVATPTGLAAGPGNTYFVGNYRPDRCWGFGTCEACDPEHSDTYCTPSVSPCCDTTALGRLAHFTLPEDGAEPSWRVVHIFEGEQIAALATGRDGTVWVGTIRHSAEGNLYRYDPVADTATHVRTYEGTAFSLTQDRRNGDWYAEVYGSPKLRRLAEDGTELPLPATVPADPGSIGVLQYGPDGKLYRLIISYSGDAGLDVYDL